MALPIICTILTLTLGIFLFGLYKMANVESILMEGNTSKNFSIIGATLFGFFSAAMIPQNKLLNMRLNILEKEIEVTLAMLENNDKQDGGDNGTVH